MLWLYGDEQIKTTLKAEGANLGVTTMDNIDVSCPERQKIIDRSFAENKRVNC